LLNGQPLNKFINQQTFGNTQIVFGSPQSEAVLKCLLKALLDLQGQDRVVELEILSPNPEKFYFVDKGPILDLSGPGYESRHKLNHGCTAAAAADLSEVGPLLGEKSAATDTAPRGSIPRRDSHPGPLRARDEKNTHYNVEVQLPKFAPDKPRLLQTRFERWLYVLKFSDLYHNRELPENLKEEEGIEMAIDAMRKAYAKDEIRAVIEAQEKAKRDEISRLSFAERKGREAGREEVARRMLELGIEPAVISQATGYTKEELEGFVKS
jgi:hypothetical protein